MPGSGEAASYGDLLVTSLLVLGGVCIAAFVVVRFLGRFLATGPRRGAHLLDVVARMPLEPRRSLYVVEVAGKTLLVGTSEMGLSVLTELDRDAVQARVVERPTFAEMVRTAWTKRKANGAVASIDHQPGARNASEPRPPNTASLENASAKSASAESASAESAIVGSPSVASPSRGSVGSASVVGDTNAESTNAIAEPGHTPARKPGEPA